MAVGSSSGSRHLREPLVEIKDFILRLQKNSVIPRLKDLNLNNLFLSKFKFKQSGIHARPTSAHVGPIFACA